ncbi:DMT family transporter [Sphingomonas sp.]|jgi:drug/metabolite transporter (DMT)-like permease|uniref:DMT family transporter n=1 Tax=Sphingomonas sp. TaxID=28214 RepID=UPI002ED8CBC0
MQGDRIFKGLGLRLFAILCLSGMSALVKLAETRGANLAETMFHRQFWAALLVTAWIAAGPGLGSVRTARFGAHLRRAAVGLTGMIFTFGSVLLLPLAEATTLQFTVPIFATILGALVLREKTGRHRWAAVVAGFVGVLIVAQPGSGHFPLHGAIVGLLAALFVAVVAILLRQIGRTESTGTTVFWFSVLSLPPLALAYSFQLQAHDALTWAILVAIGLVGGVGQLALTGSLRFAPVSVVVPMDYSSLIWATLYGWLIFGALPTGYTWLGAPLIIASGLYIVWRERLRQQEKPAEPGL